MAIAFVAWAVTSAAQGLYCRRFTTRDGLGDNLATTLLQARNGYLWLSTHHGIYRWDGRRFEPYVHRPGVANSLSGNTVYRLAEDQQGRIWAATQHDGVSCYDPVRKTWTSLPALLPDSSALLSREINEVYCDRRNRIWIGYWGKGWTLYDPKTRLMRHFQATHTLDNAYGQNMDNLIDGFADDAQGNLWVASNAGLHYLDVQKGTITSYRDPEHIANPTTTNLYTYLYRADDTTLWLGSWGCGLKKFNTRTHRFTRYLYRPVSPHFAIYDIVLGIARKSEDELWLATADKGLVSFNTRSARFTFYPHDPGNAASPLPGECYGVTVDRDGGLWAAYTSGIIYCASPMQAFHYTELPKDANAFATKTVSALWQDPTTKTLYVGAIGGSGLYAYDDPTGKGVLIPFPDIRDFPQQNGGIMSIEPADQRRLLLSTYNGLYLFHKEQRQFSRLALLDQDNQPVINGSLIRDVAGNYWTGTASNGLYWIDRTLTRALHYHTGKSSPIPLMDNHLALAMVEGDSVAWIHETSAGFARIHVLKGTREVVVPGPETFNPLSMIRSRAGDLWAATFRNGLCRLNPQHNGLMQPTYFSRDEGVGSDRTADIVLDQAGRIWATCEAGIATYLGGNRFKTLGEEEGFSWGPTLHTLYPAPDGFIYCGVDNGWVRFRPEQVLHPGHAPPLVLQSLKVFDREWSDTADLNTVRQITLPYNRNFLSAEFAALSFRNPEQTQYAWMLEGVDDRWVEGGNRNYLSYSGLAPGSYTLHIRARNSYGLPTNTICIKINIMPPFWKTWWFSSLILLLLFGVVYAMYQYRLGQVRHEEALKTAFNKKVAEIEMKALRAQMNPHFIFNSLNSINRYIVKSDQITASSYLTKFAKLMRLILESSASGLIALEQEIELLRLYAEMESLRFKSQFTYEFIVAENLNPRQIMLPSMLIQPYMENAIWHGLLHREAAGHLQVRFFRHQDRLHIVIRDNGVGRARAAALKSRNTLKEKSYGMKITGDRVRIVNDLYGSNATIAIVDLADPDGEPAGTEVTLEIPLDMHAPGSGAPLNTTNNHDKISAHRR